MRRARECTWRANKKQNTEIDFKKAFMLRLPLMLYIILNELNAVVVVHLLHIWIAFLSAMWSCAIAGGKHLKFLFILKARFVYIRQWTSLITPTMWDFPYNKFKITLRFLTLTQVSFWNTLRRAIINVIL